MARLRVWLLAPLAALPLSIGCANPCDDLAEVCDACSDASYASECRAIVAKQNHSVCSADIAIFRPQCPLSPATSGGASTVTSVTGTSASSSTATSSTSGAGGAGGGS
jgi:hypothetical protein